MPKSTSQQFLWVNKDASSASLSNNRSGPQPYTHLNRHAQKGVKRRLPVRKKQELVTSTSRLVGWQKTPTHDDDREAKSEEDSLAIIKKEEEFILTPSQAVDSFCNPIVGLDVDKQSILQYFNDVWMPSKGHIPHGCQVTGFTPIWPGDRQLSQDVVRGAVQSNSEVSIYALLTASTRRMRMVNKVNYPNKDLPDFYALRAIQALRNFIASGEQPSERLVLDMSYLILAELYVKSPSRSDVYWKMTRNLIVNCGGLHNIGRFTAQAALAYDFFIAAGTLTTPALNPFEHPVLLGLGPAPDVMSHNIRALVVMQLRQLDPRVQVLGEESDRLSHTIRAIRHLPKAAVNGILPYLQDPGSQLYTLISAPFLPSTVEDQKQAAAQSCIKADALAVHVRFHAYMIWLWYCALDCIGYTLMSVDPPVTVQPPTDVLNEIPHIWKHIDRIHGLLGGTGWTMQTHVVLWISAVGFLVATSEIDRRAYTRLLVDMAARLSITNRHKLKAVLDKHLPLDRLQQFPTGTLWSVIAENLSASATGYGGTEAQPD